MTQVRVAVPGDVSGLARIAEEAFAPYVAAIGRRPPPMVQDFAADIAACAVWVVGRPPAGFVVARPRGADWLLENVAVSTAARGTGLGRALIAFAEDEGRRGGHARIVLYTNAAMTANLALYPRLGYRRTGLRVEHGLQRVYFEKELA